MFYFEAPVMRHCLFFLPVAFFSCSQHQPENTVEKHLGFDIDTVMVDAGDEILDLGGMSFALSPNRKFLYAFNRYHHALQKIDLEELRLVEMLPFEKEGPNGTVNSIYYLNMLDENLVNMSDYWTSGQFQLDGTRTVNYNLYTNELQGDVLTENERLNDNIILPEQPWIVFALVSDWKDKTFNLRKMDFRQKEIKKYDIDREGKIPKYSFKVPSMSKDPIISPTLYLSVENGKLIISSNITNEIHLYEPLGDSLVSKSNHYKLTANEKTGEYPGEYASIDDLMANYQKVAEEISFLPPVWDGDNERYYRFSHLVAFEKEKAPDAALPEISRLSMYISAYDKDFELLAESTLPLLLKGLSKTFVRDGKIWLEVNIKDELGFIRIDLKEK
jgi:hypothetical protein